MMVYMVRKDDEIQRVASYLEMDEMNRLEGLSPQSIVGIYDAGGSLIVNSNFREFLHEIIAIAAPLDPDMQRAASAQGDGRLVYIDSRVPAALYPLPGEDILGWFQVRAGQIVDESYRPNPRHRIQGAHGITAALGAMRQAMVNEIIARQTR